MIKPETFLFDVKDGVATITLNRPERLNALTFDVYNELKSTFFTLRDARDVRVVVITGAGRAFCSGGDVRDIIGELMKRNARGLLDFTQATCALVLYMRRLPKPILASINGTCVGAGAMIALASDIRLAADDAKFAFLFTKVGLSGADMGACHLLPRIVGLTKATELLMTGDMIDAKEAHRIGLVNRTIAPDQLRAETAALAQQLAKGPGHALGVTKECLNNELSMQLEEAIESEARAQAECMEHPDFREGYLSFLEKRAPNFRSE